MRAAGTRRFTAFRRRSRRLSQLVTQPGIPGLPSQPFLAIFAPLGQRLYAGYVERLLAEDLMLLADDDNGKQLMHRWVRDRGVAGALLPDLAAASRLICLDQTSG